MGYVRVQGMWMMIYLTSYGHLHSFHFFYYYHQFLQYHQFYYYNQHQPINKHFGDLLELCPEGSCLADALLRQNVQAF